MVSFFISIAALILGYILYGKFIERIFGIDPEKKTPAITMADGIDYVAMPRWKIFLIQFLNIAGLGPIFGAVAGAMWGPIAFLWIVVGSIFAGGVHDYFSGMLSIKHKGESITEITGFYLGDFMKKFMSLFSVLLLILVGAVFIIGPATIIDGMTSGFAGPTFWILLILGYYILSTLLPIDKIIGKIYPFFGAALIFMAIGIAGVLIFGDFNIPELSLAAFSNTHVYQENFPVFPMLFITIACGAISGFHATQSPLMARCVTNEKQGRSIFYGAMITEGILALIWAAVSMTFFGGIQELNSVMVENQNNAAFVVNVISNSMLGKIGGFLALLGVVAAPITSGDTAFRSARLIIADFFKIKQRAIKHRLYISIPLFIAGYGLTLIEFGIVWRYFAWTNQTLATIVLWVITAYLIKESKLYLVTLIPAVFMTAVVVSYILIAPEGFSLPHGISYTVAAIVSLGLLITTLLYIKRSRIKALKFTS